MPETGKCPAHLRNWKTSMTSAWRVRGKVAETWYGNEYLFKLLAQSNKSNNGAESNRYSGQIALGLSPSTKLEILIHVHMVMIFNKVNFSKRDRSTWLMLRCSLISHRQARMLGAGALGWPRGMVWGGRRVQDGGTHVYLWRIHFDIWQSQYNIVKLKNKIKLN